MQAPRVSPSVLPILRALAGVALFSTLAACGFKGPLYMPPPPAPDESLTTPPTPAPLPPPQASETAPPVPGAAPAR